MKILLVDDEVPFVRLLQQRLEDQGHDVVIATEGVEGLARATDGAFDVAVVDVMLPGLDGFELTKRLRASGSDLPVLILTARDAVPDRVAGLHTGADDYLIKPFAFAELLARIDAITRRARGNARFVLGGITLDVEARLVTVDGDAIELTAKEFDVLEYLLRNAGKIITRRELKEAVWGFSFDADTKSVDLYVHYVRRKLKRAGAPDVIRTSRGVGYGVDVPAGAR
ncbi:MAG TPA: response regulator transcription factor [Actinomycetota bacterium]|nr:response regulator transcription factor [Actinomycetota bacterium]